jgi:DNA-binding transcriptional MocR family regulator
MALPARAPRTLLFERVAEKLREAIAAGILAPGDRLPSVRELALQERVSVSTVLQAYQLLEAQDLVEARPQSGHYVRLPARPALALEPATSRPPRRAAEPEVSDLVRRVYAAARDDRLVQLGAAVPSIQLLPAKPLNRILAALAREVGAVGLEYDMPPGWPPLRQQLARRSLTWGCALSADDFITTCGASEAVSLCLLSVARPGDIVAIESPAYYGVLRVVEALGLRALEIPTHPRDGIQLDVLAEALRKHPVRAVLVVTNFSNPLGTVMPDARKQELVELVRRAQVPLIEDDIYGDLHFGPLRPRAAKAWDKEGWVMLCGSFSKTLAPGWRVGWMAPGRFSEQVELLKFAQTVATPTLLQMAIAEFLQAGGYDRHLRTLRRALAGQMERMRETLSQVLPEGTRITRPEGGTLLWVQMPEGVDALALHAEALERGIAVAPGPIFSATGTGYSSCIRINTGMPDDERIHAALRTLGDIAQRLLRKARPPALRRA